MTPESPARSPQALGVVAYDPHWATWFEALGGRLRESLGEVALRIDHIGSTAVPGLAAKPIIDVQVSVASLEPVAPFLDPIQSCGFVWRRDNTELTKRYFRETPGARGTHIHVRRAGSFDEQFALLFRDYLRQHADSSASYARLKHRVAHHLDHDRQAYVDAKAPFIWDTMRAADEWAQSTGWQPGSADA